MDFNAAIFDLDGTILDSMDVWEHIDIQFLLVQKAHGIILKKISHRKQELNSNSN